jgi:predicted RNA-binding Zn-ribbon protein involved in translation (DUF1610 family)
VSAPNSDQPHIERTHFDPLPPPEEVALFFCPACGQQVPSTYNYEPARKRCTKTWHLAAPKGYRYRLADSSEPEA